MEHEYTINGRILPELSQVQDLSAIKKFIQKIEWAEEDFKELKLKIKFSPCDSNNNGNPQKAIPMFSMDSKDIDKNTLEQACLNLSVIFNCTVSLCKDHEIYGVANVFNGGSDYEVVDENCFLWIFACGTNKVFEQTKYWNTKFADLEQEFLKGAASSQLLKGLSTLNP